MSLPVQNQPELAAALDNGDLQHAARILIQMTCLG
jgi:hypothetical protein